MVHKNSEDFFFVVRFFNQEVKARVYRGWDLQHSLVFCTMGALAIVYGVDDGFVYLW